LLAVAVALMKVLVVRLVVVLADLLKVKFI
jgi:hypothetical protein